VTVQLVNIVGAELGPQKTKALEALSCRHDPVFVGAWCPVEDAPCLGVREVFDAVRLLFHGRSNINCDIVHRVSRRNEFID
jgi:hypothetical protein